MLVHALLLSRLFYLRNEIEKQVEILLLVNKVTKVLRCLKMSNYCGYSCQKRIIENEEPIFTLAPSLSLSTDGKRTMMARHAMLCIMFSRANRMPMHMISMMMAFGRVSLSFTSTQVLLT